MLNTPYRVLKFGGTSVGAPERLMRAFELIKQESKHGPVAIVVSAMGKTTDWLLDAASAASKGDIKRASELADQTAQLAQHNIKNCLKSLESNADLSETLDSIGKRIDELKRLLYGVSLLREQTPQTTDLILSFGERISATAVAALFSSQGTPATFVDSRTWILTDDTFGSARVNYNDTRKRLRDIQNKWGNQTPICTGFLGETADGRTTTLGRNGSDYTATLLARCLDASEVQIWTDVSGVMTADPRIVKDAYPLKYMSYMEAVELAMYGTRMFHARTMIPLIESGIPMRIRNTVHPEQAGTKITAMGSQSASTPTSVTSLEHLALIDVEWRRLDQQALVGERVLRALGDANIPVWMASQGAHGHSIAVAVPDDNVDAATSAIATELSQELARYDLNPIGVTRNVTLLSLVCDSMSHTPNVAGRFFSVLGAVGVNLKAIAQGASSRSISCIIDGADTQVAVRTVHTAFNFATQHVNLLVLGKGIVGQELLNQIHTQTTELSTHHDVDLRVVGILASSAYLFAEEGLELSNWPEQFKAIQAPSAPDTVELLNQLSRLSVPILVDCTAADGMEALYSEAFARGIHVVAANKKPLTESQAKWQQLIDDARLHHRAHHYETTVGASLPVIDTLKNLVRTGDTVNLIEGCFSGTLGYLTNEVMNGVPLSQAVKTAKELGYTEPQPQDDLSGLDVARKALILARELGLEIELSDVSVVPLVPDSVLANEPLDEFFNALLAYDAEFEQQITSMKAKGESLRYLARIDPSTRTVEVGPMPVPANHPAAQLRGSEAFVAFTTQRHSDYPVIVRGAGAGGAVTAAGVLADILRITQTLRGR